MKVDFGLRANYQIESVTKEFAQSSNLRVVSSSLSLEDNDKSLSYGEFLLVKPNSKQDSWILNITGDIENTQCNGVYSCPNPDHFLVILESVAFHVAMDEDILVRSIDLVRNIRIFIEYNLILLCGYNHIVAIGESGILWESGQLCRDDLSIVRVTQEFILGHGNFIKDGQISDRFKVCKKTGSIIEKNIFCDS